jgi:glucose 1-dehydrogenase
MKLAGQVAVVSGGLGAIGQATVRALANQGADISWCDVHPPERATALLRDVEAIGRRGHYVCIDVANPADVERWIADVESSLGTATLIVPNAAVVDVSNWFDLTVDAWQRLMAVNLDGAFYLAHYASRPLVSRGLPGRIVFVGSWAAEHVHLEIPSYCVSKAGLRMLAKCVAGALAPHGVVVNEISPGFVAAGLADEFVGSEKDRDEESRRQVPIGRTITPEEVAAQIVLLCDPGNRHMVGSTLLMDGGLSLFGTSVLRPST